MMTSIIYFGSLILMSLIRLPYLLRTRHNQILVSRKTFLDKALILQFGIGSLVIPLLAIFTSLLDFANYQLPPWTEFIGAVVCIGALWFFWSSHVALGENWFVSLELRQGHELVTTGVYKHMRHPMYAAIWLWCLAQPLVFHNWVAGWSFAASFALMYFLRVPREEQMMLDQFGNEYRTYMSKTGRVFPRLYSQIGGFSGKEQ